MISKTQLGLKQWHPRTLCPPNANGFVFSDGHASPRCRRIGFVLSPAETSAPRGPNGFVFSSAPETLNYRLPPEPLVRIEKLAKVYRSGDNDLVIFRDLALDVEPGEQVAIIGESGAGKSTLLHLISGLDTPTEGAIYYKDKNITQLPEPERSEFRNREIGYVWQLHHLLPEFTAMENVSMPLRIRGVSASKATADALTSLEAVGLTNRAHHRAGELSG